MLAIEDITCIHETWDYPITNGSGEGFIRLVRDEGRWRNANYLSKKYGLSTGAIYKRVNRNVRLDVTPKQVQAARNATRPGDGGNPVSSEDTAIRTAFLCLPAPAK